MCVQMTNVFQGHMPKPPGSIMSRPISPSSMHVSWKKADNDDDFVQLYAVYYRLIDDENEGYSHVRCVSTFYYNSHFRLKQCPIQLSLTDSNQDEHIRLL